MSYRYGNRDVDRAVLIDQLTRHDRRYKHDYAGVEQTTDDLTTACMTLDLVTTGDELEWPSFEQVLVGDAELESEVEDTLQTLRERGLIERGGTRAARPTVRTGGLWHDNSLEADGGRAGRSKSDQRSVLRRGRSTRGIVQSGFRRVPSKNRPYRKKVRYPSKPLQMTHY